jgi:hypothetical protein
MYNKRLNDTFDAQSGTTRRALNLVAIPLLPQRKQPLETTVKLWARSTVSSKVRAFLSRYSGLARSDIRFTEYRFHNYYKENGLQKLL